MRYRNDPDGTRLPIKLDATTNGEFAPVPLEPVHREARFRAMEAATANANASPPTATAISTVPTWAGNARS